MTKQTQRIIIIAIFAIIVLVNIPSIIGEQLYNSLISNIPLISTVSSIFDFISLYQLTKSNMTNNTQILKLISLVVSFFITLLTKEKVDYIFCSYDEKDITIKFNKIISSIIIYFFYALLINVLIIDTLFKPITYSFENKLDSIVNQMNQIGK